MGWRSTAFDKTIQVVEEEIVLNDNILTTTGEKQPLRQAETPKKHSESKKKSKGTAQLKDKLRRQIHYTVMSQIARCRKNSMPNYLLEREDEENTLLYSNLSFVYI